MSDRILVVTGANSYLGKNFIHHLAQRRDSFVYALVLDRPQSLTGLHSPKVMFLQANLSRALPKAIQQILHRADKIVHFAWARSQRVDQACDLNRRMVDPLLECLRDTSSFRLISSVGAGPTARSVYARVKFDVAQHVVQQGGVAVACGLVTGDPPRTSLRGPFAFCEVNAT